MSQSTPPVAEWPKLTVRLPASLMAALRAHLHDPFNGKPLYGSLNALFLDLTTLYLFQLGDHFPMLSPENPLTREDLEQMRLSIKNGAHPSAEELAPYLAALAQGRPAKIPTTVKSKKNTQMSEAAIDALFD